MTQKRIFAKIIFFFKKVLDKFRLSWYNNLVECGGIAQLARALGSYPGCHWFESDCRYHRPVGQEVKTSPFHGGIMGSIPVRVTISIAHIWLNKAFCGLFFLPRNRRWVLFGSYFYQAPLLVKLRASATALQALTWFSRNICP